VTKCIILAAVWKNDFSVAKAPKRAEKGLKHAPYGPKINENLTKCLQQGVCPHPGCFKQIDPSAKNRVL
jgi:hypothetical protein